MEEDGKGGLLREFAERVPESSADAAERFHPRFKIGIVRRDLKTVEGLSSMENHAFFIHTESVQYLLGENHAKRVSNFSYFQLHAAMVTKVITLLQGVLLPQARHHAPAGDDFAQTRGEVTLGIRMRALLPGEVRHFAGVRAVVVEFLPFLPVVPH